MLCLLLKRAVSLRAKRSNLVQPMARLWPRDCFVASLLAMTLEHLIFKPARRYGHAAMPGEDGIDLRHVGGGDSPAEGFQVLHHLGWLAEADQRRADYPVAQGPAQRELREGLVVFRGEALEVLDGVQVAAEMLGTKQGAEQVEIAEHAAARAPVALFELHAGVKGAAKHAVSERSVGHDADLLGRTIGEDLCLHAPVEHVPAILHDIDTAQSHAALDLRHAEVRQTDIARLALLHDV